MSKDEKKLIRTRIRLYAGFKILLCNDLKTLQKLSANGDKEAEEIANILLDVL